MKSIRSFIVFSAVFMLFLNRPAAQVSINSDGSLPDSSAMLDVKSSAKGFLAPRMTAAERDAIVRPAKGLLIFCTDNNQYYSNQGTCDLKNWMMLSTQWLCNGSNIHYPTGNVGIGISNPSYLLHVVGGDVKIGNTAGDARKLYFGDGANVYVGEEATDNRLGLLGNSLMISIGGSTGSNGQVLTSNGVTCSWITPSATGTGTADYLTRWLTSGTLGIGITRDNNSTVGINAPPDPLYRLRVEGGGNLVSIYGRFDATRFGYLGHSNWGAYGQYNNNYGGLGTSDYGVYGYNTNTVVGDAGVYGYNAASSAGTHAIYGYNSSATGGTAITRDNTSNGVVGYTYWGSGYHFGVFGSRYDDSGGPSAGVIGTVNYSNASQPWGALGYQDASDNEYAGYFNGNITLTGGINDGSGYGLNGSVLLSNGSDNVSWSTSTGILGTGTVSWIPKFTNTTTLANSGIYDNGTNIGIGTISPSAAKLVVNSGAASTSVYGQYNASILGYLGSSGYGAYGQNSSTQFGYLGGSSYGVYGQNSSTQFGYLGSSLYGAYGQSSSTLYGYLGSGSYGAYGQNSNYIGILGSSSVGAWGQYSATLYGYLGSSSKGVYGQYNSNILGYLGSSSYGAYGQNSTTLYGYLGGGSYGAYGQYNTNILGYLGGANYGVYGQSSSDIYGYLGGSSYGVYGKHNTAGGSAGYFYHNGSPSTFTSQWTIDAYMMNNVLNDGTSYSMSAYNSGCIRGYSYNGPNYSFGVAGWNWNDDNRCAGTFGGHANGDYWGALGYEDSGYNNYGGYFTSSTTGTGKKPNSNLAEGIGIGAWGGLMGADIHGGIYGIFVEGNDFGLYSKGAVYADQPIVQLQDIGEPEKAVLFANTSTDVTVMTSGVGSLSNGHCSIHFDNNFKKVISGEIPLVITVTPMGPSNGVYISSSNINGFIVSENNGGTSNITFSFIAVGRRAGYENPQLPADIVASDFETNMMQGVHKDADNSTEGKGLYYGDGRLQVGHPPSSMVKNNKK